MITNPEQLAKLLCHGVYVVGVRDGDRQNAFTASWVMQVSFKPFLLAISINPLNYSYALMQAGKICTVNVLSDRQYELAAHFGSASKDKMTGYVWQTAQTGAPVLSDGLAYFDCKVSHFADAGDHKIAVCEVVAASIFRDGQPLLYGQTGNLDGSKKLY
jgi:flavin reductase (DIM6/NTAB) family NADH-FMN oxidoreductase RutF